jgi:hypothetical protein
LSRRRDGLVSGAQSRLPWRANPNPKNNLRATSLKLIGEVRHAFFRIKKRER